MYRLAMFAVAALVVSTCASHAAGSYQTKPMFPDAVKATVSSTPEVSRLSPSDLVGGCGKGRVRDPQRADSRAAQRSQMPAASQAHPEIVLRALPAGAQSSLPGEAGVLQTRIQVEVRGAAHILVVPVRYDHGTASVTASGDIALKQSELGLTPFSALLGALQVQDEMRVRFRIVAHATALTPY